MKPKIQMMRFLAGIVSFAAVALWNFAVGWELVAFFPSSLLTVQADTHIFGAIQMVLSFVLYAIGMVLNKEEKGD